MFKIIIAGGREFNDYNMLKEKVDVLLAKYTPNQICIISGCARGADSLGERYAKEKGMMIEKCPADWDKLGKSAGYKRNQQMALIADALIAFWDGKSKGTEHMINIIKTMQKPYHIIRY